MCSACRQRRKLSLELFRHAHAEAIVLILTKGWAFDKPELAIKRVRGMKRRRPAGLKTDPRGAIISRNLKKMRKNHPGDTAAELIRRRAHRLDLGMIFTELFNRANAEELLPFPDAEKANTGLTQAFFGQGKNHVGRRVPPGLFDVKDEQRFHRRMIKPAFSDLHYVHPV